LSKVRNAKTASLQPALSACSGCPRLDPKKTSRVKNDLIRKAFWAALEDTGWRPVSQIAID
jgi:hypothetical protein